MRERDLPGHERSSGSRDDTAPGPDGGPSCRPGSTAVAPIESRERRGRISPTSGVALAAFAGFFFSGAGELGDFHGDDVQFVAGKPEIGGGELDLVLGAA